MSSFVEKVSIEIDVHKWIESQKVEHDLGEYAIHDWIKKYYWHFLRKCWIEHILGEKNYIEFNQDMFDICHKNFFLKDNKKIAKIIEKLKENKENINIFCEDASEECYKIMEILNINSWRIRPREIGLIDPFPNF